MRVHRMPEAIFRQSTLPYSREILLFPSRVVIEAVEPQLESGRFPIKRICGEKVIVSATIHADGHNAVVAELLYRHHKQRQWNEVPMKLVEPGLDLWQGEFCPRVAGTYEYTLHAWVDRFENWRRFTRKKLDADQYAGLEILEAVALVEEAARNAEGSDKTSLLEWLSALTGDRNADLDAFMNDKDLQARMRRFLGRHRVCLYQRVLEVVVEPARALYGAWYELFPRSCATTPGQHGTFKDVIERLPYIARMGFDVLYLPPVHPIGETGRKGANNSILAKPGDPGSPWAIGGSDGGHKAIHPGLGTLSDFDELVAEAKAHGLDVALDLAFQCSPDHPYVNEHPDWFEHRLDGSIRFAENPPKKYEDIYPLDFECQDWESLWKELADVTLFWIEHGVKIFRVDNPHTKPYAFWTYLIREVKRVCPEAIFLAEAFARPALMKHLALCGFSQSYTYFTWRNTKSELTEYLEELTKTQMTDYLRPNFFANTPDILPTYLQAGGRAAFMTRAALAATLSASYGIYGPAFELCVADAVSGTEEYKDSEKYQIRCWDLNSRSSIAGFVESLNEIRRGNPALRQNRDLCFVEIDNSELIAYIKASEDGANIILTVVNLDPHHIQSGWLTLPSAQYGLVPPYQAHDLLSHKRFLWSGESNFVQIDPEICNARIFRIERRVRREHDYDYFA